MIKDVGLLRAEKKNKNKGDLVMLAHSVIKINNSLKTEIYICYFNIVCIFVFTALIHCTPLAVIYLPVFRLLFTLHVQRERGICDRGWCPFNIYVCVCIRPPKVIYHSLCRVGTHSSTHQYKLSDNIYTNPTSGGSL